MKQTTKQSDTKPLSFADKDGNIQNGSSHYIGDYKTAPDYMKDNDKITHGYRINFDNPKKILRSLFMVHNESVNIWSHCVPAIFIIIFLISFYFMVDSQKLKRSFDEYKIEFQKSIQHYSHALQNLTLISEYDKLKNKTKTEIEEIKQNAMNSYYEFVSKFNSNSEQLKMLFNDQIQDIKNSLEQKILLNLKKFQKAKLQFENIIAPMIINEFNQKFNSSLLKEVKEGIDKLKTEIDSDLFKSIQLNTVIPNLHQVSRWPIFLFLTTAAICLLSSALFHLFYPMSSRTYIITNRFDYAGVNLLISGSSFPPIYYGMYCQIQVATIYLSLIIMVASTLFTVCLFEWIHRPGHEKYKAFCFGGFGLSLCIPLTHLLLNQLLFSDGADKFVFSSSAPYYVLLGISYLSGLYVYTVRCPERNNPGKYNLCGHSHQIWHGFVVLGIIFTYLGALQNFEMRKVSECPIL